MHKDRQRFANIQRNTNRFSNSVIQKLKHRNSIQQYHDKYDSIMVMVWQYI